MLRRQNRLRREFLYKKEQEARDAATVNRKQQTKDAKDQAIKDAKGKGKEVVADDQPDMDDEYGQAGVQDPKILVTTSRDPSSRLAQFAKHSASRLPPRRVSWLTGHVSENADPALLLAHRKCDWSSQMQQGSIVVARS